MAAKIVPHLWYTSEAEEAAQFYCSVIPNSRIDAVTPLPVESPSGPAGTVKIVDFTLSGQKFQAISAGPLDPFNHAISFIIHCDNQAEIDRIWDGLLQGGGNEEQCGWLKDRYGVSWQVIPAGFEEMMRDPVRGKSVAEAMLKMIKFDIAALQKAAEAG